MALPNNQNNIDLIQSNTPQTIVWESLLAAVGSSSKSIHVASSKVPSVQSKIYTLIQGGPSLLHIISDFDMTITKYWTSEGKRSVSSHGILTAASRSTPEYKQKTNEYYAKYYPMEISQTLNHEAKVAAMIEWWSQAHDEILKLNLTRSDILNMVKEVPILLRPLANQFIHLCATNTIPLLVFSAGLYDLISDILDLHQLNGPNIHIVSNQLSFDPETNVANAFIGKLIHVFNKNEAALNGYETRIAARSNTILIGDSLGDLQMGDGIRHKVCLTIGFLNHDTEALLEKYTNAFDIVITNDESFAFIIALLGVIIGNGFGPHIAN